MAADTGRLAQNCASDVNAMATVALVTALDGASRKYRTGVQIHTQEAEKGGEADAEIAERRSCGDASAH